MKLYPGTTSAPLEPFTLGEKLSLSGEIAATYVLARWWLWRRTLDEAVAAARSGTAPAPEMEPSFSEYQLSRRLGDVVERRIDHLPGDTRCLTRSLVLLRILTRRGIPASLSIGVRNEDEFSAHAWVELGGHPLLSPSDYAAGRLIEI
jgi:hypothetical protein